jgi:hypothetical protein
VQIKSLGYHAFSEIIAKVRRKYHPRFALSTRGGHLAACLQKPHEPDMIAIECGVFPRPSQQSSGLGRKNP